METHVDMDTVRGFLVFLQDSQATQMHMLKHWVDAKDVDMAEVAQMEQFTFVDLIIYLGRLIEDAETYKVADGAAVLAELADYADSMFYVLSNHKNWLDNTTFKLNSNCLGYRMKVYAFVRDTICIMTKVSESEKVTES